MCPISIYTGIQGYCEETKDNVAYVRLLAEVLQYSLKNLNYIVTGIKQQGCTHNNTRLCDCEKRYDVHVGAKLICNNISKDELDTYRQQQVEILPQEQPDKPPCEELLQSYARHRDAQAVAYEFKLSMFATQVLLSKCGLVMEKI
ncbi:MAG: hypothetical protein DRP85_08785 [Candidatus Makaraimicrobium thalassicum]|nr:MAG: hypothetical protein DRP85_08785 [Candidatus Omnitrophota bacterium]